MESLETRIHEFEVNKEVLQVEVNANSDDYLVLHELTRQLQTLDAALDSAITRWLELVETNGES